MGVLSHREAGCASATPAADARRPPSAARCTPPQAPLRHFTIHTIHLAMYQVLGDQGRSNAVLKLRTQLNVLRLEIVLVEAAAVQSSF